MTARAAAGVWFWLLAATVIAAAVPCCLAGTAAGPSDPAAKGYAGHKGVAIYVSKRGDNSDGTSWPKAFRTIQTALLAVPDDRGGHTIVIRPDTYVEANLYTRHKGAEGAYNLLVGDCDGRLGSGATGRVVIDSSDPQKGFKSLDWWGTFRATTKGWSPQHTEPTFSCIDWDRWIFRNLYVTGGDGGLFWDLTDKSGSGFTVVAEDCVGIGRAFGGGFGYPVAREKEPIVLRRCYLMCLDWWGDAGALAVGAYNNSMPAFPDAICEDCTLVGPDNALQILNPSRYVRLKLKDCRLIVLNFSQPGGTPSSGIICSDVADPKYAHVDLEDCTLMGYKVFGTGKNPGQISYTTKGNVRAYVQYQQSVPKGFQPLALWPAEVFDRIQPPQVPVGPAVKRQAPANPRLVKLPFSFPRGMENTPVVFRGRALLVQNDRSIRQDEQEKASLFVQDMVTGQEVARLGTGFSFVSAFVSGEELNIFGTVNTNKEWTKDIYRFRSSDLKSWKQELAIRRDGDEHLFNTSVCRDGQGFLMAYESNKPVQWSFRFARSKDLARWERVPGIQFADVRGQSFCACPTIRHVAPYYYVLYGIQREKGPGKHYQYLLPETKYVTAIARSRDLALWEVSPTRHPMLDPIPGEGINNTDADLFEFEGNTYVYYGTGDQATWGTIRVAMYAGPMKELFEAYFPAGVPAIQFDATQGRYLDPSGISGLAP